jgi:hypothetical protein
MRYAPCAFRWFVIALALIAPFDRAQGQPVDFGQGQQQLDDLRRRVEEVERQLFQQRMATPMSPGAQGLERLEARLTQLERELSSERIARTAAGVISPKIDPNAPVETTIEMRISALEAQRAGDAKVMAALEKRVAALEKARPRSRVGR